MARRGTAGRTRQDARLLDVLYATRIRKRRRGELDFREKCEEAEPREICTGRRRTLCPVPPPGARERGVVGGAGPAYRRVYPSRRAGTLVGPFSIRYKRGVFQAWPRPRN